MQGLSSDNDGTKYILTMIDVFSKQTLALPLKNKGENEMLAAFHRLLKEAKRRKPERLQTDAGKEFLRKEV